jgi:hypothetical protein
VNNLRQLSECSVNFNSNISGSEQLPEHPHWLHQLSSGGCQCSIVTNNVPNEARRWQKRWQKVHRQSLPLLSANGQGSYDAQVAEYLCTCMVLSIHLLRHLLQGSVKYTIEHNKQSSVVQRRT